MRRLLLLLLLLLPRLDHDDLQQQHNLFVM